MSVPKKTFTGLEGQNLGGTNGAGTINGGGLQRDLMTLFAMFNPEATRPDGEPGGIRFEHLVLGDIKMLVNFWDSGWLRAADLQTDVVPDMSTVDGAADYFKTFSFPTPLDGVNPLYEVSVWEAVDSIGTNMVPINDPKIINRSANGFAFKIKAIVVTTDTKISTDGSPGIDYVKDSHTATTRTKIVRSTIQLDNYTYQHTIKTTVYTFTPIYTDVYLRFLARKIL